MRMTLFLAALTGLLLVVGAFFGGTKGMTIMFVVSLLMNVASFWFSDRIILSMYGARQVTPHDAPELIRMVSSLAQKAKLPMPKVCIIESEMPNAFATGRTPAHAAVAVTTGLMRVLTAEELEGVLAHELAHIKNRDTLMSTIVASVAGVITMIASIAQWTALLGVGRGSDDEDSGNGFVEFVFLVVFAPLAASLIQMGISRSREFLADETGSGICGNPLALASALRKIEHYAEHRLMPEATPATSHLFIVSPFAGATGNWVINLFSTHPSTRERIKRLEDQARGGK